MYYCHRHTYVHYLDKYCIGHVQHSWQDKVALLPCVVLLTPFWKHCCLARSNVKLSTTKLTGGYDREVPTTYYSEYFYLIEMRYCPFVKMNELQLVHFLSRFIGEQGKIKYNNRKQTTVDIFDRNINWKSSEVHWYKGLSAWLEKERQI